MQVARSASGARRLASRGSAPAVRQSPVSASPTTPYPPPRGTCGVRASAPQGPWRWATHRTWAPKDPAWSSAYATSSSVSGASPRRSSNATVSASP